jgi:hypothetical protein
MVKLIKLTKGSKDNSDNKCSIWINPVFVATVEPESMNESKPGAVIGFSDGREEYVLETAEEVILVLASLPLANK